MRVRDGNYGSTDSIRWQLPTEQFDLAENGHLKSNSKIHRSWRVW